MSNPAKSVISSSRSGVGRITFAHPKANSLSQHLLNEFEARLTAMHADSAINVILISSFGSGAFSGGASFEEFRAINSLPSAVEFFSGFARVILAMRQAPQPVVLVAQGRAVGGAVGLIAAADYVLASTTAEVRLSELDLGIGPFVIAPALRRKIGIADFGALALDRAWRSAEWAFEKGLFSSVHDPSELTKTADDYALALAALDSAATAAIKTELWRGTEEWTDLLLQNARTTARLLWQNHQKI